MAFVTPKDRVAETTATTGTATFVLSGALTGGYRTFGSVLANNDTTYYAAKNTSTGQWEIGIGTWTTGGNLARTTILASSNAGAVVNFSSAPDTVFNDAPSEYYYTDRAPRRLTPYTTATLPTLAAGDAGAITYCSDWLGVGATMRWTGAAWVPVEPALNLGAVQEISATSGTVVINASIVVLRAAGATLELPSTLSPIQSVGVQIIWDSTLTSGSVTVIPSSTQSGSLINTAANINLPVTSSAFFRRNGTPNAGNTTDWTAVLLGDASPAAPATHAASHQSAGTDALTGLLDATARVVVRKNSGSDVGARRRMNLIEGSGITLTVADDAGGEEVDVTITSTTSGGGRLLSANVDPIGTDGALTDFWLNALTGTLFGPKANGVYTNLMSTQNSFLEGAGVGTWGGAGTLTRDTTQFKSGVASLKVVNATLNSVQYSGAQTGVVAGRSYTHQLWAFSATAGQTVTPKMDWLGVGNSYINSSVGTAQAVTQNVWTLITLPNVVAPVGAISAEAQPSKATVDDIFYDDILINDLSSGLIWPTEARLSKLQFATVTLTGSVREWTETQTVVGVNTNQVIQPSLAFHADSDINAVDMLSLITISAWVSATDQITFSLQFAEPESGPIKLQYQIV